MIQQQYPSQLLEKAVQEFSKLPGIGRKTALRLVLWMLRQEDTEVEQFAEAIKKLKGEVKYCQVCHNISDSDICPICSDHRRDKTTVCVVENIQDVMAISVPTLIEPIGDFAPSIYTLSLTLGADAFANTANPERPFEKSTFFVIT